MIFFFQFKGIQLWVKPILPKGSLAIVFFNTNNFSSGSPISVQASDIGMANSRGYQVTEVFKGKDLGTFTPDMKLNFRVFPTDVYMIVCNILS